MSNPQDPGGPPPSGPQGPWQQPPGPGGPQYPGRQPSGDPGSGYGTPPGPPPGGYPGTPGSPYPPPPGGRPPGGGGNAGLVLVIASVCVAVLVIVGGVAFVVLSSPGSSSGADGQSAGGQGSGEEGQDPSGGLQAVYEGTWDGTLDQYDSAGNTVGTWSLTVEIAGDTISAEEYGLGDTEDGRCTWEIADAQATESSFTFSYTVADDPDCVDNGQVVMEPAGDDSLDVTVTSVFSDGTQSESTGTLHRQ
ncbi:hypothetical protein FZ103_08595 [Streptomonospora sp. PA3]|uniref:hypothetical protein n=1 Tax=Streptomonospora sp. PA3 TaxID=2607326 RepID=UPI0012DF73CE|nr:hypothetical protein [Streptomonospora sp. PA3]MUL41236.1 hypothetical protein [Streptomonospora sp. PA3]